MKKEQEISESVRELILKAWRAGKNAYAPYSGFRVGAALLAKSGRIYTGCNVESASFSPTCCAERTALCKAISEGERGFAAIAVVGVREGKRISVSVRPAASAGSFCASFARRILRFFSRRGKRTERRLALPKQKNLLSGNCCRIRSAGRISAGKREEKGFEGIRHHQAQAGRRGTDGRRNPVFRPRLYGGGHPRLSGLRLSHGGVFARAVL